MQSRSLDSCTPSLTRRFTSVWHWRCHWQKPEMAVDGVNEEQVWSTNRCVFRPIFSTLFEDRRTDQQTNLPVEMQFYIFVMLLVLPDDIHEEKPSFLQFKKNALRTDRRTDGPTDRPSYRDARTHLKTACSFIILWP